jgi:ABC-type multidrug transport system fused ATPase/permease subunit
MFDWLYNFSDEFIVLFWISLIMGLTFGLIKLIRASFGSEVVKRGSKLASDLHPSVVVLCSLVLTFSLLQVLDDVHKVDALVAAEATQINNLDRILTRYGDPSAEIVRPALHIYAKSIVQEEWPMLLKGQGSQATLDKFKPLSQGIFRLQPHGERQTALFAKAIELSEQIAQSRDARIETSLIRLPLIYWLVIALTFIAVAGISGILESDKLGVFQISLLMMALAGMVALIFAYDRPYLGDSGVKPGAIEKAIEGMDARQSEIKLPQSIKLTQLSVNKYVSH